MAESKDAIDAAIQSAESLFASLLDRAASTGSLTLEPGESLLASSISSPQLGGTDSIDVRTNVDAESSLMPTQIGQAPPDQSLHTMGTASLTPDQLTAHAHAVAPLNFDPSESLHSLANHPSIANLPESPDYDTVVKMLKDREKDLELTARIGQTLLQRNKLLEVDLVAALDQKQQSEQQVAQLKHTVSQKENLLKLYARDARERDAEAAAAAEDESNSPAWVHALAEECKELRESNDQLQFEASNLRKQTADIEQKERELVQQCLTQFGEARHRLGTLREELEVKQEENLLLQSKLLELSSEHSIQLSRNQQLLDESEILREQVTDLRDTNSHLNHEMSELQERFQDTSVMLKEAQEEITALKEISLHGSSPAENGEPTQVEHESIVREIEEALRQEIIAASTLPERPRSPNHYAHQRTMVVMETVRAATLATARRLERLATEAEKQKQQTSPERKQPSTAKPSVPTSIASFSPLAASSPNEPRTGTAARNKAAGTTSSSGTAMSPMSPHGKFPPSPTLSDAGSTVSMPDEMVRYRNQPYVAPEKLQIVKPLEGSMTLLKWKLLASPQLGGATTFFSDAKRPGVHLKKTSVGEKPSSSSSASVHLTPEAKIKSLSVNDLSVLSVNSPSAGRRRTPRQRDRARGSRTATSNLMLSMSSAEKGKGMNTISGLLPSPSSGLAVSLGEEQEENEEENGGSPRNVSSGDAQRLLNSQQGDEGAVVRTGTNEGQQSSSSFLSQMGSLFGSGWTRLGLNRNKQAPKASDQRDHRQVPVAASTEVGLAGLL